MSQSQQLTCSRYELVLLVGACKVSLAPSLAVEARTLAAPMTRIWTRQRHAGSRR